MRSLFWKEWRELRSSAGLTALLTFLLIVLFEVYDFIRRHVAFATWRFDADFAGLSVAIVWSISAGLVGSRMIAGEVGSGTLQFLSSLPITRRRLWTIKLASGLTATLAAWIATILGWLVAVIIFTSLGSATWNDVLRHVSFFDAAALPWIVVGLFSAGLFTSTLFDRVTGAAVACVILCVPVWTGLAVLSPMITRGIDYQSTWDQDVEFALGAVIIAGLLRASYRAFTRGESLRTPKRFVEASLGLLDVALLAVVLPLAAFLWLIW